MYNHIKGALIAADPARVVVECGGVGFSIRVPLTTFETLPKPGEECLLLIHLHVREDALELFGFGEEIERRMFRKLISISGVGPSAAMSLMSQVSVEDICAATKRNDPAPLKKTRGIGKKTADRIVLELRGAVEAFEAMMSAPARERAQTALTPRDFRSTTALALVNLGYSETESDRAAQDAVDALGNDASLSDLLKEALKRAR
jgi:Holliday junction DNA helicase RuvA